MITSNGATYAFTGTASDVILRHLDVSGFNPPEGRGTINGRDGNGWLIEYNEVHHNTTGGIYVGANSIARGNRIHHNGQIGVKAKYANPQLINNEISWNNYQKGFSYTHEAGGSKFTHTTNLIARGNYVHDNWGPGLWTDINNVNTLYEDNRVEDNADIGIFHEVSCSATIINNTVRRNGFDRHERHGWMWGAGITIAASGPVHVEGNAVENNAVALALIQQNRGDQPCSGGPPTVHDVTVTNNAFILGSGQVGGKDTTGDNLFTSRNNVFYRNTYTFGTRSQPFVWAGSDLDLTGWRRYHPNDG